MRSCSLFPGSGGNALRLGLLLEASGKNYFWIQVEESCLLASKETYVQTAPFLSGSRLESPCKEICLLERGVFIQTVTSREVRCYPSCSRLCWKLRRS
ncbi:hypothetical protein ATANTOWER_005517 [Ataeniobius toweri]|uniref:Uncharacterized protein n=1 Tax=Ataeniobius toweri TaxID=208326 RepID=A0ABU7BDW8_9TELE|nr:hypothetical protein [Ataeniobius toweri]